MNDAYLRATMSRRHEIIGQPLFEAFPSDPASESYQMLQRSLCNVLVSGNSEELALIRYDIRNPDGSMDVRYWSATSSPLKDTAGQVEYILQHTVDVTELHGLRRLRDEMGLVKRASAVQARNRDLTLESKRLKSLFEQAPGFVAILSGQEYRFVLANAAYRQLVGRRDVEGQQVAEALPEVVAQGFIELLDDVYRSGAPYVGRRQPILLRNEARDRTEERFVDFIFQPISDDEGQITGIFVLGHDVTDEAEAAERQKLLIHELNHRVKNTLAIVQGLAAQSFGRVENSHEARQTFDARLNALAAAHSLLTSHNWKAAYLHETVRNSIEATAGSDVSRFHLSGPDFSLDPQTAVSLAMIVHELATNAIKYGALSQSQSLGAEGRIVVSWRLASGGESDLLTIDWIERGGPRVTEPTRRGFGTRLIHRGLGSGKDSKVVMEFDPEGLHCRIVARVPRAGHGSLSETGADLSG